MCDKLFSIGEVATLFHISISSLRHYESIGLLIPEYVDEDTGYRFYSVRQFEALNSIRYLRELNMPLKKIREFLTNKDVDIIEEKLKEQKKDVLDRIKKLKDIEAKINNRLIMIEDAKHAKLDEIEVVEKKQCKIAWMKKIVTINNYLDMEPLIRKLEDNQQEAMVFLGKVGLAISSESLKNNTFNKYDGIFLILDEEDNYKGEVVILPLSKCVRIRFCGSHSIAPKYYKKLLSYIKTHNYKISGFAREITMIDYGITNDVNKFVTEICIPIKNLY